MQPKWPNDAERLCHDQLCAGRQLRLELEGGRKGAPRPAESDGRARFFHPLHGNKFTVGRGEFAVSDARHCEPRGFLSSFTRGDTVAEVQWTNWGVIKNLRIERPDGTSIRSAGTVSRHMVRQCRRYLSAGFALDLTCPRFSAGGS